MKGVDSMEHTETKQNSIPEDFIQILDNGINDMEAGQELPLDDAFNLVAELVEKRDHF